jgi:hypothetical protein
MMTALHYQLAFARHQGGFDALVLADSAVAQAGPAPGDVRLLAAYAFLFANDASSEAPVSDVEIQKLMVAGGEVLLCARGGGTGRAPSLDRAASGCRRILSA